jgi:hypothetical protein
MRLTKSFYKGYSNEGLVKLIVTRDMTIKRQSNIITNKQHQIRALRVQLKKIRDKIDYLLKHPWAGAS